MSAAVDLPQEPADADPGAAARHHRVGRIIAGPGTPAGPLPLEEVVDRARALGLRRLQLLAWRDLDDPEAGGSELHAHRIASLWAAAGLDVTLRTSRVPGAPAVTRRDGYEVRRSGGRYSVFARAALEGPVRWARDTDGLVEIWNGMPFFSPLWARRPHVVFLHHVHAEMWDMVLPPRLARLGRVVEARLAPPLYRAVRVVTLSESSRREIVELLGIPAGQVTVVRPGVDRRFSPGGSRHPDPLVVAVGRLVTVKRFDALIDALAKVKTSHPRLRAMIVGEGSARSHLEARRRALGADDWIELPGHLSDDELLDVYRRAWVVASASQREGWGMTLTEAGACGTPAVATRIAGHLDAVGDGRSGMLVDEPADMAVVIDELLADDRLRARLGAAAQRDAARLTWEATAAGTLAALVGAARHR